MKSFPNSCKFLKIIYPELIYGKAIEWDPYIFVAYYDKGNDNISSKK